MTRSRRAASLQNGSARLHCYAKLSLAYTVQISLKDLSSTSGILIVEALQAREKMSNAEPALPWGLPKQDEASKVLEGTEKPVDLKAGQRVRVRLDLSWQCNF